MKIHKIIWKDIAAVSSEENSVAWFNKEELIKEAERMYQVEYVSIGVIVKETEDYVLIAATYDTDKEVSYSDASIIPKGVIVDIVELVDNEKEPDWLEEPSFDGLQDTNNLY